MSPRFLAFMPFILKWESVYDKHGKVRIERDPDDPGNWVKGKLVGTKYGIDARSHPNIDIAALTEKDAIEIYYREYWLANDCEKFAPRLGEVYMNCAVNAGAGRAQKLLKLAGNSGLKFLQEQEAFYRRLAAARPKSKKYLKGWLNRTNALRKYLGL